jgi:hypothetical protein
VGDQPSIANAPPMFVVHGVNDLQLSYNEAVRTYNKLSPPKGFLTLEASDHTSYLAANNPAFNVTAQSTADFLDGVLRHDRAAFDRLAATQWTGHHGYVERLPARQGRQHHAVQRRRQG